MLITIFPVPSCFQHEGNGLVELPIQKLEGGGTVLQLPDIYGWIKGHVDPIYYRL